MLSPTSILTIQSIVNADSQATDEDKKWINTMIRGSAHLVPAMQAAKLLNMGRATFFRNLKSGNLKLDPIKRNERVVLYRLNEVMLERARLGC